MSTLTEDNVMNYSALCYFFAKLLYQQTGVPVGIVNSSWGGTPVEAWISESGLKDFPSYLNQKAMYECDDLVTEIKQSERMHQQEWQKELYKSDKGLHTETPGMRHHSTTDHGKQLICFLLHGQRMDGVR